MSKKEIMLLVGSIILLGVLGGLFILEKMNPEGGVLLLSSLMESIFG